MIEVMTDYKYALVFSHKDIDGILAAFAVKYFYDNNLFNDAWEKNVKVHLCDYSEKFSLRWFKQQIDVFIDEVSKITSTPKIEVFMLDYAIQPNENMQKLANYIEGCGAKFIWCDHHITAIENLLHYNFTGIQNTKFAGCVNSWNFLNENANTNEKRDVPILYKMANEFDLWHENSAEFSWEKQIIPFSFFVGSLGNDINDNTGKLVKTIKDMIENPSIITDYTSTIGKAIYNWNECQWNKNIHRIYESNLNGMSCLVINSLGDNTFEFEKHPKYNEVDLLIRWCFDGKKYIYGIYTTKDDIDVGEICTSLLNGGGHRKAGGGVSDKLLV